MTEPRTLFPYQRQVLSLDQDAGSSQHVPFALWFSGELDVAALTAAVDDVVADHPALATGFVRVDRDLRQVRSRCRPALDVRDVADPTAEIDRLTVLPFTFDGEPLVRLCLLRQKRDRAVLLVVAHRGVFDGTSKSVLVRRLAAAYNARTTSTRRLPVEGGRYWPVQEALTHQARALHDSATAFFANRIPSRLDYLPLRADRPIDTGPSWRGNQIDIRLGDATTALVHETCTTLGISPFVLFLSLYHLAAQSYAPNQPVTISVAVNARPRPDPELIGMFANNIPVHDTVNADWTLAELTRRLREQFSAANRFRAFPMSWVERHLRPRRAGRWGALSQLQLTYRRLPDSTPEFSGVRTTETPLLCNYGIANDLCLAIMSRAPQLDVKVRYSTDLFDDKAIAEFVDRFSTITESVCRDPRRAIGRIL